MTKQLFLLNSVSEFDAGNIGGDQADQMFFTSVEELEKRAEKERGHYDEFGHGLTAIHLVQVDLDDHDVVTGVQVNRFFDPGYCFVGKDTTDTSMDRMARLKKWLPADSWELPDHVMPPFFSDTAKELPEDDDPEATYIAAIKVGEPITYKKIDD